MRLRLIAAAFPMLALTAFPVGDAQADTPDPPYIDRTKWVEWGEGSSLRIYPTPAGRTASAKFVGYQQAWSEVLAQTPDANQPGMRSQFACHWHLAEFAEPGKLTWNLEPWRPVVDETEMWQSGCNPGGSREPF